MNSLLTRTRLFITSVTFSTLELWIARVSLTFSTTMSSARSTILSSTPRSWKLFTRIEVPKLEGTYHQIRVRSCKFN